MSIVGTRYRPPRPQSSAYITPEGARKLREEVDFLWKKERPRVTHEVSVAAAHGDRSENAEYIYGKKRLREIDARLRFLQKRLDVVSVVDARQDSTDKVYFGAWVRVENEEGDEFEYRIVGPDEANSKEKAISMDSPVGRSLLGKSIGDDIVVSRPKGKGSLTILGVRYA